MRKISGWGRYPVVETEWLEPGTRVDAVKLATGREGVIARGNGRAYGDAAIGTRSTLTA